MTNNQTTCDTHRIELFLQQKLSDGEQAAFESHLSECDDCCRRLEATAACEDVWRHVQVSLRDEHDDSALDSSASEEASTSQATILKLLAPTDDDRMIGRWGTYEVVGVVGTGRDGRRAKGIRRRFERPLRGNQNPRPASGHERRGNQTLLPRGQGCRRGGPRQRD